MNKKNIIIFIENFKSIFQKQMFELSFLNINTIIGPNGTGKTNIIEAMNWLIENTEYNKTNTIIRKDYTLLDGEVQAEEFSDSFVGIAFKIDDSEKKSICEELGLSPDLLPTQDYYKINYRKTTFTGKFKLNSLTWENKRYLNFYQEILHLYLKKTKNDLDTLNTGFIINKNEKFSLDTAILLKLIQELEEIPVKKENDTIILIKYKKILEDYEKIKLNSEIKIDTRYIENASYENETEYYYTIDKFEDSDFDHGNDLLNLLSANVDLSTELKKLKNIIIDNNSEIDEEIITKLQSDIFIMLNKKCNEYIDNLFSSFDIYAKPRVNFNNNKIVIEVVPIENSQVGAFKTIDNSSGYRAFFELILKVESLKLESKKYKDFHHIIFADEPDKNLHPFLQNQLSKYFQDNLNEIDNLIIIITTHSPFFIIPNKDNFIIVDKIDSTNHNLFNKFVTGTTIIKTYKKSFKGDKLQNIFTILFASKILIENDLTKLTNKNKIFIFDKNEKFNIDDSDYSYLKSFCKEIGCEVINLAKIVKSVDDILVNKENYILDDFKNVYSKEKIIKDINSGKNIFIKI